MTEAAKVANELKHLRIDAAMIDLYKAVELIEALRVEIVNDDCAPPMAREDSHRCLAVVLDALPEEIINQATKIRQLIVEIRSAIF